MKAEPHKSAYEDHHYDYPYRKDIIWKEKKDQKEGVEKIIRRKPHHIPAKGLGKCVEQIVVAAKNRFHVTDIIDKLIPHVRHKYGDLAEGCKLSHGKNK